MPPPDTTNDKSRISVLVYAVEVLTKTVKENHDEDREWRESYAGRLRAAENDITFLKTVYGVWGGVNSIGIAILTFLGIRQ